MNQQPHLRPVEPPHDGGSTSITRQQPRQHAGRALPTDRLKIDVQIRALQTLGRISGQKKEPVGADVLSRAMGGIAASTVGLSNRFWKDTGWLTAAGRGKYAATDALVEYGRRLAADPARAVEPLAAAMRHSWYWQYLDSYLAAGPLAVNEAVIMLMHQADAGEGHLPMIRNIIAWMEFAGLVVVQGDRIVMVGSSEAAAAPEPEPADVAPADPQGEEPTEDAGGPPPVVSALVGVDLRLTEADLDRMTADQIKEFFSAVGTALAIKHGGG